MYTHILIPTDGSVLSENAVTQGVALAKAIGATVTVVTVSAPYHIFALDPVMVADTAEQYQQDIEARAEKYLGTARETAAAAGVTCEAVHVMATHPYEGIIRTAASKGCDLIVMASHGRRGLSAVLLGSETAKVLTHTKIPVLVCR